MDLDKMTGAPTLELEPKKEDDSLTPEEQKAVTDLAGRINISDSMQVIGYGANIQKKMATFSEGALASVKTKDLDEVGGMITSLVTELKGFNPGEEKKGIAGFFSKLRGNLETMKTQYDSVSQNVDKISNMLDGHKLILIRDVKMLDQLYEQNLEYFREVTLYIMAGKKKLEEIRATELAALKEKAVASNAPEDAQAVKFLEDQCVRFEKKIYDLELTRTISMQQAPQIRMIQETNNLLVDKIQSSIMNTIPLWKNQMVLALGIAHSKQAMEAQRKVTDTTNELLRKNADLLKQGTIDAARESERGLVDVETLTHTNEALISTLDEVLNIQREGRAKRVQAEGELLRIEEELKHKLLEIRDNA